MFNIINKKRYEQNQQKTEGISGREIDGNARLLETEGLDSSYMDGESTDIKESIKMINYLPHDLWWNLLNQLQQHTHLQWFPS